MSHLNHTLAKTLDDKFQRGEFEATGYWDCSACGHVTEPNVEGVVAVCGICLVSGHMTWHKPKRKELPAGQVPPVEAERVKANASEWFAKMRAVVNEQ